MEYFEANVTLPLSSEWKEGNISAVILVIHHFVLDVHVELYITVSFQSGDDLCHDNANRML